MEAGRVKELAQEFLSKYGDDAGFKLDFAATPDDIERVYLNGPDSCMSKQGSTYQGHEHPVRVYGAGDLAIAYMTAPDEGEGVIARVVCWPEKKVYGRVYPNDNTSLPRLLQAQGYAYDQEKLHGARLLKIDNENSPGYIMPYIDGCGSVTDHGDYFTICGSISADSTNGLTSDGEECPHCEECGDPEYFTYVRDADESWCASCVENNTFYCAHTGETYSDNTVQVSMHNGDTWCQDAFDEDGFTCEGSGENYPNHSLVPMQNGESWSTRHFRRNGHQCPECDAYIPNDYTCSECTPETDAEEAA
jgi:hypothetical protein